MATLKEIFNIEKNKKNIIITSSILAGTLALGVLFVSTLTRLILSAKRKKEMKKYAQK